MNTNPEREAVGAVLAALPSGLFVLVCGKQWSVVSWVQQAGFAPPMISVALAHGRAVAEPVRAGQPFVLSVIPEGQAKLTRPFLAGQGTEAAAQLDEGGVVRGALGWLQCRYVAQAGSGDHDLLVAEVLGGACLLPAAKPHVHLRRDGWKY